MPKWHHESVFGPGPRRSLDREQRARFKFLAKAHRVAGHITADHHDVAEALLRRLGADGRCDPTHETLADDAGCKARTVRRALDRLHGLGLVRWHRRIIRQGWRVVQTSNAYILAPDADPSKAAFPLQTVRGFPKGRISGTACPPVAAAEIPPLSATDMAAAQAALAARRAVVEARLAGRQ
jgi:hypothetical protein